MTTIDVYYNGNKTTVTLENLPIGTTPYGYLYNRVTKDMYNALAITDSYVLLSDVLAAAGAVSWSSLVFWVDDGDGPEEYTAYAPNTFTNTKLTSLGSYYDKAAPGTVPADLYLGDETKVPTVIALKQASGTIPADEVSGDAEDGYFFDLLTAGTTTDQSPRLFWGLTGTTSADYSGSRFPQNIVYIYVS